MTKAPSIKEALELKPCPFCNTAPAFGRMIEPDQVTIGCNNDGCLVQLCVVSDVESEAVKAWNTRATFQTDGERREAIARILADPKHQERARYVQGFLYGDDHVIRDVALRENQELFRTKDEHEYEQRLEIEKAKFAADAILASGLVQNEAASDGLRKALIKRAYAMSESHLSGYRLTIGFENLEDMQAAHMALPIRSARNGGAS